MKMIIGALALTLAVPAVAAPAPTAAAHADHAKHKGMDHGQLQQAKHDCKAHCEKMHQSAGKMDCMNMGEAKPAEPASGGHHSGHTH